MAADLVRRAQDSPSRLRFGTHCHELYVALIGPVEDLMKDKRHLIVVPSLHGSFAYPNRM